MAKRKLNLKGRKMFKEEQLLTKHYFWIMQEDDLMLKAGESSFLRYVNDSTEQHKFYQVIQPFKFKKRK